MVLWMDAVGVVGSIGNCGPVLLGRRAGDAVFLLVLLHMGLERALTEIDVGV